MKKAINKKRLFIACSFALVFTAMTFSIRANLLGVLGEQFNLTFRQTGEMAAAAFWGFTAAMFIGGTLSDKIGLKRMYAIAFFCHLAGIIFTLFSTSFFTLFYSTLLVGVGNGLVESASYTMISSMYANEKANKINAWHIWFPAGIVIGGVISYFLSFYFPGNWQIQILVMILPIIIYGALFYKEVFPQSERVMMGVSDKDMVKECLRPVFVFMILCMLLTAATELGTNQWIVELLSSNNIPAIFILVFINGIIVIGRANANIVLKRFSSPALLLASAILSFAGLLWLSYSNGYMAFAAAGLFAAGICFFWPTMIGFVSEYLPKTGPLGLSIMGGSGLLSTALILPYMGLLYEKQLQKAGHVAGNSNIIGQIEGKIKLIAGAVTLRYVSIMPLVLILAFAFLYYNIKRRTNLRKNIS